LYGIATASSISQLVLVLPAIMSFCSTKMLLKSFPQVATECWNYKGGTPNAISGSVCIAFDRMCNF